MTATATETARHPDEIELSPQAVDLRTTGRSYGHLTPICPVGKTADGHVRWLATCGACGREDVVLPAYKFSGGSGKQSCGCRHGRTRHGHTTHDTMSPEYVAWIGMLARTGNPNQDSYPDYGGRGIKVCERWKTFDNFLADMGRKPSPTHSLHRLHADDDYGPNTTVWAPRLIQARNKRNTVRVEYMGRTKPLTEWCDELGLPVAVIRDRLRNNWSVYEAFWVPVVRRKAVPR